MNKIIAHRGFSSKKLENTMPAFELAFKEKYVDIVELDVRMTKDNKIVCIHNSFIADKVEGKEYIKDKDYDELKKPMLRSRDFYLEFFKYASHIRSFANLYRLLKYRRKRGRIPLLKDVLKVLPDDKEINIEIKGSNKDYDDNVYEQEILKIIDKFNNKKIAVVSFDQGMVLSIKAKRPKLKVGILIKNHLEYLDLPLNFVAISKKKITYEIIKKLLDEKKEIQVYTINTYCDYLYLKKVSKELFGKLSLITDFPDLIYYLIKNKVAAK